MVVTCDRPAAPLTFRPESFEKVSSTYVFSCFLTFFLTFGIFWQTLRGSFSAVATPIFARKYSFENSRWNLQDLHTSAPWDSNLKTKKNCCTAPHSRIQPNFIKRFRMFTVVCYSSIFKISLILQKLSKIHECWWNFFGISAFFTENKKNSSILQFPEIFATKIVEFPGFLRNLFSKS